MIDVSINQTEIRLFLNTVRIVKNCLLLEFTRKRFLEFTFLLRIIFDVSYFLGTFKPKHFLSSFATMTKNIFFLLLSTDKATSNMQACSWKTNSIFYFLERRFRFD